jgi:TolA-binding protein
LAPSDDFPLAHYWLGETMLAENDSKASLVEFQRAFELGGNLWALAGLAQA